MRLNNTQKYAIQWLMHNDKSVPEIVKELKLPEKTVSNFVAKNSVATKEKTTDVKSGPVNSKDLMIRHTNSKNNNQVAVMTKEASEVNDANKKHPAFTEHKHNKNIFKITE
jgi:hypothetical protein